MDGLFDFQGTYTVFGAYFHCVDVGKNTRLETLFCFYHDLLTVIMKSLIEVGINEQMEGMIFA